MCTSRMIAWLRHTALPPCVGLLMAATLLSCAMPPAPRTASFDPHEYAPYGKAGTASVTGQVFLSPGEGGVTSGAGCKQVFLEPVTTYSTEWVEREVIENRQLAAPDPRVVTYRRTTQTDGAGFFRFENLPAGAYYAACRMQFDRWIMTGNRPTMFEELVWVHARVDLAAGQHGKVVLAH